MDKYIKYKLSMQRYEKNCILAREKEFSSIFLAYMRFL